MLKTKQQAKNIKQDGNGNRSKHYINGISLFRYCEEKGLGKAEYARCLWLIQNKCMTPEEALNYHRPPAREDKEWIRKVNQRRRYGIKKEYLELPDKYLIEMGHDKMSKYFYKGMRLKKYCEKRGISYTMVYNRIKKFGLKVEDAIRLTKKELMELLKKTPCYEGKKTIYIPTKKEEEIISTYKKKIINIETLEIFNSLSDVARVLGTSASNVHNGILLTHKVKGQRLEYLSDYETWTSREKEKHTRKNNIYFL